MKLKSRPDDFQVEELTQVVPTTSGEYAYYQLEKVGVGTPEAIQKVCKTLRIDPRQVRYGGLKDRHAQTIQYLTIDAGPPRDFRDDHLRLKYLGKVDEPYGPQSFYGNRFVITLRDIEQPALDRILEQVELVRQGVVANYYDDQRFGSVTTDNQFVARALIDGDDELALKLAISSYYEHDRSQERRAKDALRNQWGNWEKLSRTMPPTHLLRIAQHLARRPEDFRGAFGLIPFFLRNMYLSAFQSHLWNCTLAEWVSNEQPVEQLVAVQMKKLRMPMLNISRAELSETALHFQIPLATARLKYDAADPAHQSMMHVLQQEGLRLEDVKLKQHREPFFSKGTRAAFYVPEPFAHEVGWDKLHKGNRKLKLQFDLPRGCYATMLVKRLTAWSPWIAT